MRLNQNLKSSWCWYLIEDKLNTKSVRLLLISDIYDEIHWSNESDSILKPHLPITELLFSALNQLKKWNHRTTLCLYQQVISIICSLQVCKSRRILVFGSYSSNYAQLCAYISKHQSAFSPER